MRRVRLLATLPAVLAIVIGVVASIVALRDKPVALGESDDYMLQAASLERRASMSVTEDDLAGAMTDFPEFAAYLHQCCHEQYHLAHTWTNDGHMVPLRTKKGEMAPWYFGTYSALCIPAKKILGALGLPLSYAFAATNAALFLAAILALAFVPGWSPLWRACAVAVLGFSPILFYVSCIGVEVFLFASIVFALVFWERRRFVTAALFTAIGGSMNAGLMAMGFFIIASAIVDFAARVKSLKPMDVILPNLGRLTLMAIAFLPGLAPLAYYRVKLGVTSLQAAAGYTDLSVAPANFLAYIVDLNFGVLPYLPLAVAAIPSLWLVHDARKQVTGHLMMASFFAMAAVFSCMVNVDCAMCGISRYNAWAVAALLFGELSVVSNMAGRRAKTVGAAIAALSVILSAAILSWYGLPRANKVPDCFQTPIARFALDNFPQFVWMRHATFIRREAQLPVPKVRQRMSSLYENCPVCHVTGDGVVTKALVSNGTWDKFVAELRFDEGRRALVESLKRSGMAPGDFYYVSIPQKMGIRISPTGFLAQNAVANHAEVLTGTDRTTFLFAPERLPTNGQREAGLIWLDPGKVQYGPYIPLLSGCYEITVLCDKPDSLSVQATADAGRTVFGAKDVSRTSEGVRFRITLEEKGENVEVVSRNTGSITITISGLSITPM